MAQPVIAAVAVINNKNFPLYIRCFIEDESTVQFSFYAALDRFTDKEKATMKSSSQAGKYLGKLLEEDGWSVYGFLTPTRIRIMVILAPYKGSEAVVEEMLRMLYLYYVNAVSNPFAKVGAEIKSERFEKEVRSLVQEQSKRLLA